MTVALPAPGRSEVFAGVRVHRFPVDDFLESGRWSYETGQHVTFLGPTDCGKTTLGFKLIKYSARPTLPAFTLVMKPHEKRNRETGRKESGDKTVEKYSRELGHPIIRTWPPPLSMKWRKPPGMIVWPKHSFDIDADDAMLKRVFGRVLRDLYAEGDCIIFGDEVYGLAAELGLQKQLIALWTRGRTMGAGLWSASQRPANVPLWAYSMASHVFIHHDPDKATRDRYRDIGGVDPKLIGAIVERLPEHAWLYFRRKGRVMCIVDP